MKKRCFLLIGVMVVSISMGCAELSRFEVGCPEPSRVEMDYGTSYKLAIFNQTLNPDAEKNLEPVEGFDGMAARAVTEKYRKGFQEKPETPAYSLSLGSIGTGM